MTDIQGVVAKRSAYKTFANDVNKGLNHAYLFISEDGLVREAFLTLAAKRVFCKAVCGRCSDCVTIEENRHPDVVMYDGSDMKVGRVNELTESASLRPMNGDRKLFLIDNAEKLSVQAQNKLLKTYEEPPEYVTIILAAAGENGILPTIKSRAKKLYFDALSAYEAAELLKKNGERETEARLAAALADGNMERAERFLSDSTNSELYDMCFNLLLNLNASSQIAEYLYCPLFTKENVASTLDFMEIILSDVLKLKTGNGKLVRNVGREYDLKKIAEKFQPQSAAMAIYAVNDGRKKLNSNVNSVTVAESVMFDILEARYKWQL